MNKIFSTKDLPWKIVSVIFAFLLWVFVINTQNPRQPQEISGIKINVIGLEKLEDAGYELANSREIQNQNFKVVVNGPRLEIDKLVRNPQLIVAKLDITEYLDDLTQDSISKPATYQVSISSDISGVMIKERIPQITEVIIEKRNSKEQKVTYEIDESITKKYTLLGDQKPIITPEKITISGAKTDIDRVSEAKVFITAENFSEEHLVSELQIQLLDADGNPIPGLEMSESKAEVKLPIGSEKIVPLKVNLQGQLQEGYELVNTLISPSQVTIIGKSDVLDKISEISLAPIDLSSLTEKNSIEVDMLLPEGVITLGSATASILLDIEQETTLSYPIQTSELELTVKGIGDGLSYEILTPTVNVTLSALSNKLIDYMTSDIKATLDLSGYTIGEYTLPLVVTPPEGARVVNNPINIHVRISEISNLGQDNNDTSDSIADDNNTAATETPSPNEDDQIAQDN